ncbi:MAG: Mrp/NBP35 family ATP-binding protein [Lachnospiraceae bacterium]|nr:Mrp/NBP35 family ATP-binding protein [Lachnospiraceae bacterium]
MSSECNHNCEGCSGSASCIEKNGGIPKDPFNPKSSVKKVIAVVSGKGGVGKSLITSLSAIAANRMGYTVGILDADITGPSIPRIFGIQNKAQGTEDGMLPQETENGIRIMSVNLILENESDPVAWRGPILSSVVRQFWNEVIWGDLDFLFIDMPPGTSDVMLTTFQSIPVDYSIMVTSPQELVSMIVGKAVNMANQMDVPILGLVENMSYIVCPDCGKKIPIFGESRLNQVCSEYGILPLGSIPMLNELASLTDKGSLEEINLESGFLDPIASALKKLI